MIGVIRIPNCCLRACERRRELLSQLHIDPTPIQRNRAVQFPLHIRRRSRVNEPLDIHSSLLFVIVVTLQRPRPDPVLRANFPILKCREDDSKYSGSSRGCRVNPKRGMETTWQIIAMYESTWRSEWDGARPGRSSGPGRRWNGGGGNSRNWITPPRHEGFR